MDLKDKTWDKFLKNIKKQKDNIAPWLPWIDNDDENIHDHYPNPVEELAEIISNEKHKNRYKLGFSLSGGGARGFAHLGVLQLLKEKGIMPNIISGTSAGAVAGALYADGHDPYKIAEMFKNKSFQQFGTLSIPNVGFFKTEPLHRFLKKNLRARKISDLNIPMRIITTDLENGKMHEFTDGELIPAIIASCSVPIVFEPIKIGNRHFVDGGLFKNFPVTNIREQCDTIIGVNVSPIKISEYKQSIKYIAERTFHYMSSSNTLVDSKACDFLIEPPRIGNHSMFDLNNIDAIMEIGYKYASEFYNKNQNDIKKTLDIVT